MLETCPRCADRLGPPLKSGRQVCANCGWSSAAITSKRAVAGQKSTSAGNLLQVCGRILKRLFQYVSSFLKLQFGNLKQSQEGSGSVLKGLANKLSNLEKAIPTEVGDTKRPWMTVEEAFVHLGGDVRYPTSVVHSLDGRARVPLNRFREFYSDAEFKAFGLEMSLERRKAHKSWLRTLATDKIAN